MMTWRSRIQKLDPTFKGILLICLVGFIWTAIELISQTVASQYSMYEVVWVRYAVHLLILLVLFVPRYGVQWIASRQLGLQLLRSVMMLIMPVSFLLAVHYITIGTALSVFWISPFVILLLSMIMLKEQISWQYWLLTGVGFLCVVVIARPHGAINSIGVILALAMALSFSMYVVITRMLRDEKTITNLFYTAFGVLASLSLRLPAFWKPLTIQGGFVMVVIGALGLVLLWILDAVLDFTSPALIAPFFYSEMFWMLVFRLITKIF